MFLRVHGPVCLHRSGLVHRSVIALVHLHAVAWTQMHVRPGVRVLLQSGVLMSLCVHRCICIKVNWCI